jgi:hypothetical protein
MMSRIQKASEYLKKVRVEKKSRCDRQVSSMDRLEISQILKIENN